MGNLINILGNTYGRLTVLQEVKERTLGRQVKWVCKCTCGNMCIVLGNKLKMGLTKSCGCLALELSKDKNTTHGQNRRSLTTVEYRTWSAMKHRCYNSTYLEYHLYGGRGVKVCGRWLNSFENFYADMGKKPSKNHSIDRIDVNGDYCPENCRWATNSEQGKNKRNNVWYEYNGEKLIQAELARKLGTTPQVFFNMLKKRGLLDTIKHYETKLHQ
jgi:hypothetical protein